MSIYIKRLTPEDENQFILDNQYAFRYGAQQYFNAEEMEEQYEEEGEIISRGTIVNSIHGEGSEAYRIFDDDKPVGGIVVRVEGNKGDLELFFVLPECHSKGIGQQAWHLIERMHPQVKTWETCTPAFEKRNIHFYVNKLGFHIVEYFNKHHKSQLNDDEMDEMYRFVKRLD